MAENRKALRCGELAQLAGVSPDSIRHYERIGILPAAPRNRSGYRLYSPDALDRVRMARSALQIGFTLRELAEFLQARDRGEVPCHQVYQLAERKLHAITRQIRDLRQMQKYMRQVLRQWQHRLSAAGPHRHAMLLHSLASAHDVPPHTQAMPKLASPPGISSVNPTRVRSRRSPRV